MKAQTIQMLSNAGVFGPVVVIPIILADEGIFGVSKDVIGLIAGAFAAAGFVSSYLFGRWSDIHGRRKVLLLGLILTGVAGLVQVVTMLWGGILFFASVRIILGFCAGMFPAALLAYAHDTSGKRMGRFAAWGSAGWGVGNLSVGLFGTFYEGAFLLSAAFLFVSFAIALSLPFAKEVRITVPFFPAALIRRNAPVYLAMLIRHTGANMIWVTYPLFLASLGAEAYWIGVIYAVNAFGQVFFMTVSDRYDSALLIAIGLAGSAVTFYTFTLAGSFWEIIPSQVLLAAAWSCLYAGSLRYVLEKNEEKATASGLLSSTMSISGIVGPVLGGVSATAIGFVGTIYAAMAMSVLALIIFVYELSRSGEFYRVRSHLRRAP